MAQRRYHVVLAELGSDKKDGKVINPKNPFPAIERNKTDISMDYFTISFIFSVNL
jgi:hypothetical protein